MTIESQPDRHLVGLWHQGDFMTIGVTFEKAMAQCAVSGLLPQNPVTAGVYMADPEIKAIEDLQSFAGVQVDEHTPPPAGLQKIVQAGGRCAVMTHQGPYALLNQSYHWLYGSWLPLSGKAVRDEPCCEIYLNSPIGTDPADLLTAICLPLE